MNEWPGRIWDRNERWWGWSGCNFPPGNVGSTFQISSAFLEKNAHFSWYFKLSFCSKHKPINMIQGYPHRIKLQRRLYGIYWVLYLTLQRRLYGIYWVLYLTLQRQLYGIYWVLYLTLQRQLYGIYWVLHLTLQRQLYGLYWGLYLTLQVSTVNLCLLC